MTGINGSSVGARHPSPIPVVFASGSNRVGNIRGFAAIGHWIGKVPLAVLKSWLFFNMSSVDVF